MKQIFTFLAAVVFTATTYAQVGIGTTNPDPSAALDITSATKGVLLPKSATDPTTGVVGMIYYNTAAHEVILYNGSWVIFVCIQTKVDFS